MQFDDRASRASCSVMHFITFMTLTSTPNFTCVLFYNKTSVYFSVAAKKLD